MIEITKLGSLYFDDAPIKAGISYHNQELRIGDTIGGRELYWVKANSLLVANQVVCTNISWDQLNKLGFIFGKSIWIDGKLYLCRSLKVGNDYGVPNEWDAILDSTNEDDSLWHWGSVYFWGQETTKVYSKTHMVRGRHSARGWSDLYGSEDQYPILGFRPVLEPIIPDTLISGSMIGQPIKAYGPGGDLAGTLSGISNYDLFLSPASDAATVPKTTWCCQQKDGTIVINRSAVTITGAA